MSRTHIVGEGCERYQEERDAPVKGTKEIYEYDMEEFGTLR